MGERFYPNNPKIPKLIEFCLQNEWHGLIFQHINLCQTRTWLHLKRISCAHLDSYMQLGSVSHEISKTRDKSIEGLFGISPDRIDWKERIVIEAKGKSGAQNAVSHQTAFYAAILVYHTQKDWGAQNNILSTKKIRDVDLDEFLLDSMLDSCRDILKIQDMKTPPGSERKNLCEKCGYRFLCWGDNI